MYIENIKKACQLINNDYCHYHAWWGYALYDLKQFDQALIMFKKALKYDLICDIKNIKNDRYDFEYICEKINQLYLNKIVNLLLNEKNNEKNYESKSK